MSIKLGKQDVSPFLKVYGVTQETTSLKNVLEGNFGDEFIVPEGITELKDYCFGIDDLTSSGKLKNIKLPSTLTGISNYCFLNQDIEEIIIPNQVRYIGNGAFQGCEKLKSIILPDNVKFILSWAFTSCFSLNNVKLPNNDEFTTLNPCTFQSCSSLSSIVIPDSIKILGNNCFEQCSSLKNITLPENLNEIGSYCFQGCSALENIIIPRKVYSVGYRAFYQCTSLKSIELYGLMDLGDYCFRYCTALESVILDDNMLLDGGGWYVFADCPNLKTVTIGKDLSKIGIYWFSNCSSLTTINFTGTISEWQSLYKATSWNSGVPSTCQVICSDGTTTM